MENETKKPTYKKMVNDAITALDERSGSSILAIKKYIDANFPVDKDKSKLYIKQYVTKSLANGELLQTTGKGFAGSFKISKKLKPATLPKKKKEGEPKKTKKITKEKKEKVDKIVNKEKKTKVNNKKEKTAKPKLTAALDVQTDANDEHTARNLKKPKGIAENKKKRKSQHDEKKLKKSKKIKKESTKGKKAVLKRASLINMSMSTPMIKKRSKRGTKNSAAADSAEAA